MAERADEDEQEQDHDEGYAGPAVLTADGRQVAVRAVLDARHEPHDGRLHWFGRVTVDDAGPDHAAVPDPAAVLAGAGRVELSTESGRAEGRIGDVDPWGRYRITGLGAPPYRIDEPDLDE